MKKIFIALSLLLSLHTKAQTFDLLIKNAKIIDGTGNPWFYGDIGIKNGKIALISLNIAENLARKIIYAKQRVVCPGFIDVHTHIERFALEIPTANNFVFDGVTTIVTGNCGSSALNLGDWLQKLSDKKPSVNIASLVGHNTVRRIVMGEANRNPTPAEIDKMKQIVENAMQQGAVGFSTGLIYTPGTYAKTAEIVVLAKVAATYKGLYATHMRDERDSVIKAIKEALFIAKSADIPLEISHFKVGGKNNAGKSNDMIALVEKARAEGLDVTVDQYPYTASSTSLDILMPDWVLADGNAALKKRLSDKNIRQQILEDRLALFAKRGQENLDYAYVALYSKDSSFNGKNIMQISQNRLHRKPTLTDDFETVMDMLQRGGDSHMVYHGMQEPDVERIMQYKNTMVASDGGIPKFGLGVPHPRAYGTNARVLQVYVRERKVITLEDAIRKMTSLPAQRFHFDDRGLLKVGMAADVLIFDEKKITEKATYDKPHAYTEGIDFVVVNGEIVAENGKMTGSRPGKILYGKGKK
jgi:N-acyl-D-amino-acid deacylase